MACFISLARRPKDIKIIERDSYIFLEKIFHPFYQRHDLITDLENQLWLYRGYEIPIEMAQKIINKWLKKKKYKIKNF